MEPLVEKSKQEAHEIIAEASRSKSAKVEKQVKRINLMLAWGCEPKAGVDAETKMVKNFLKTLADKVDRYTQMIEFPLALKNIASDDANFEFMTSNSLMNCLLERYKNIVTACKAIIFVNSHLNGLKYDGAKERTVHYQEFFKLLEVDDILVFEDLTKDEIIEQIALLKSQAFSFSND